MEPSPEAKVLTNSVGADTNGMGDTSEPIEAEISSARVEAMDKSNEADQTTIASSQSVNGSSSSWCGFGSGDADVFTPVNRQEIVLKGSDAQNSHAVYGQLVEVVPSEASLSTKAAAGSNKVKINPVVNFDWEHRYYVGNLVTVHLNQTHIAYVLRGKPGGVVRVTNRKTAERILLKNFNGLVVDISFAFTSRIVLGIVDEPGNMYIYQITEGSDGKMRESLMLHVVRPAGTPPTDFHRIIWCSYIPDDSSGAAGYYDDYMLMLLTHGENAELWHVGKVSAQFSNPGPILSSQVATGFYEIRSHVKPITDAVFSPDGMAVATASQDGSVKFFKFDASNDEPPTCIHQWQPHQGRPLSCLFFLDDHKHPSSDVQFWKFVITGADYNSELKIWSCQTWTCLQTIHFRPPNDPGSLASTCCIKACLDLSATYLVLSDINRQVLYILELFQDCEMSQAHVCSLSEFLLMKPCLSLSILDAGRRKLKKEALAYSDEHVWSCTTGEIGSEENGEDVPLDMNQPDVGVLVRLYSIHTRAMQELQIRYMPLSSVPKRPCESSSSATTDGASTVLQDRLSDASFVSEFDRAGDNMLRLQVSPERDSLSTLEPSTGHSGNTQPLLMTPDAFISPRCPGSLAASTVSDSLTMVTALNEDDFSSLPVNILPQYSNEVNADALTASVIHSESLFSSSITDPESGSATNAKSVDAFEPSLTFMNSVELSNLQSLSSSRRDGGSSPAAVVVEEEEEVIVEDDEEGGTRGSTDVFLKRIGDHSHLSSSRSSSSASQEVTNIFESHKRSGQRSESEQRMENDESTASPRNELDRSEEDNIGQEEDQHLGGDGSEGGEEGDDDDDDDEEHDRRLIGKRKDNETEAARTFGLEDWPQAAGVINVTELIQSTEEAKRRNLDYMEEKFVLTDSPATSLKESLINSQRETAESKPKEQSRFSPQTVQLSEEAVAGIKHSVLELTEMVRLQRKEIEMLRCEMQQQRNWSTAVDHLQQQIDSLAETFHSKMTDVLTKHSQAQYERFHKTMQDFSAKTQPRYDELMSSVVNTVQDSVRQQMEMIIKTEMQKSVIPHIESCLEPMKEQFHSELAQKLTPIDSVLKDNISRMLRSKPAMEAVSQAASNELRDCLSGIYKNVVIPSLDRSCQDLMQKMSSLLQKGSLEYLQHMETNIQRTQKMVEESQRSASLQLQGVSEAFQRAEDAQRQSDVQLVELIAALKVTLSQLQQSQAGDEQHLQQKFSELQESITVEMRKFLTDQVTRLLSEQQSVLNDQLQNVLRSGAATPIHPFCDPQKQQQQVLSLLHQGKYNAAFQQALSATDLSLVEFVCESADPGLVFSSKSPSPLGQPVLLSLIQQLSANLSTKTDLKHRYLEEAILNLDHSSHITKEHLASIIGQLCNKLSAYVRSANPRDEMCQPMAKLLRVCELLQRAQLK